MIYPHPILAKEGWLFVAVALIAAVLASVFLKIWLALLFWLVLAFALQFFRDPPRPMTNDPLAVLAPSDGRVVRVDKVRDPYVARDALMISVALHAFGTHANRAAVDGQVIEVQRHATPASASKEHNAVVLAAGRHTVTLVQVAGRLARSLLCQVKAGEAVKRGQRL